MRQGTCFLLLAATVALSSSPADAERHLMRPRVPPDKLAEARALKSPVPFSPEVIEQGKAIYHGKGTCLNCHGVDGNGNGPAAAQLNPPPRNFRHHGFWRHRTEGEIFWVIKHGSPGTAMVGFGTMLSDEEIWSVIQYERTFAQRHGRRGMGPREGMGPRMGPRHQAESPHDQEDSADE
ncbi:c-type cytochrome [Candidatus Nitrospira inopinata]|jgi:mono/diheme cytochrome c family protein|uniref:Putative Cytochrome c (Modular protein) n=1 Tax=Candidatus Nitrospira inopinata TaxID=1715989 RepID=A0A0S4KQZ8_9BACT|nr:cytochrome c [Candidatus Nitrospira inopinata]CUQ65608.1 putative Cytochrome c (Modular protein) [Candidatus Nitrospira inopinata]